MNAAAIGVLLLIKEAPVRTEGGRFMFERQDLSGSEAVFNESATLVARCYDLSRKTLPL